MDLGNDFYLVHFQQESSHHRVLHNDLWFIGQNFLSIRKWEPKFNSNKADCKITTIWARLPLLPPEFYDHKVFTTNRQYNG